MLMHLENFAWLIDILKKKKERKKVKEKRKKSKRKRLLYEN